MPGSKPAGHDLLTDQPADLSLPVAARMSAAGREQHPNLPVVGHLQLHSIEETGAILGVCRTKVYSELKHRLDSVRIGRRRLVPHEAIQRYLANLPTGWTK